MVYHQRISKALEKFDEYPIPETIPQVLPILEAYKERFADGGEFSGRDVLFIQHHMGPLIPRVKSMAETGLMCHRTWFVDIPYSTNLSVLQSLRDLGCPFEQAAPLFDDPLAPYNAAQLSRVVDVLYKMTESNLSKPPLIIDDGAYFARAISFLENIDQNTVQAFRGAKIVEQTTRGWRYLLQHSRDLISRYRFTFVSVAKSWTKVLVESPLIGAAVARGIRRSFEEEGDFPERVSHMAVIGFGYVGEATARELSSVWPGALLDVIEVDPGKFKDIKINGWRALPDFPKNVRYDLVVGCTGYRSFNLEHRRLLADTAFLASGSSAALEFNRKDFIELADATPDDIIQILNREDTRRQGIHARITFQHEGYKIFHFMKASFPVNFDGKIEHIPIMMIQATHCLLYAAAAQAIKTSEPGFCSIRRNRDEWILETALEMLPAEPPKGSEANYGG